MNLTNDAWTQFYRDPVALAGAIKELAGVPDDVSVYFDDNVLVYESDGVWAIKEGDTVFDLVRGMIEYQADPEGWVVEFGE